MGGGRGLERGGGKERRKVIGEDGGVKGRRVVMQTRRRENEK